MGEKDFSEIARLSERYNKDPKSRIFVQLADAYRKSNMIDEALEILNKGLSFNPNYPLAYLILGKCYFDKRMYEQAKDSFGKTLNYDPQNIVALRMLAQTCEATKDEEGQMEAYRGIIAIDPFDAPAKEKLTYLESIHKKEPLYTVAMAQEYEKQGNFEKALSIYENLSFTDPTDLVLQQKVTELKEKAKSEKQTLEKEDIEGLQLDTYFHPEDLEKENEPGPVQPEKIEPEPIPQPVETQETGTTEKPEESYVKDAGAMPEVKPSQEPEIAQPPQPAVTPETQDHEEPEGLDLLEPIESAAADLTAETIQPVEEENIPEPAEKPEEISDAQDLLQPIETTPEPAGAEPVQESTTQQEPDTGFDLLQPIETSPESAAEQEEPVMPKLVDITDPEPAVETSQRETPAPSYQPETSGDLLEPIEEAEDIKTPEITEEETATETKSEVADMESPGPQAPDITETPDEGPPPETDKKPHEAKPQEEDFQSFKDWLGGLLK